MKRLIGLGAVLGMLIGFLSWFAMPQTTLAANLSTVIGSHITVPTLLAVEQIQDVVSEKLASEYGKKIDLNNANVRAFRELQGFYPTLAGAIVQNAPYKNVDDVLNIPGLSAGQRERLEANLNKFVVTNVESALVEGADRFNNGVYK